MLSDHELKTLLDIEHRLLAEDPGWARTFDTVGQRTPRQRAFGAAAHIVTIVLAVALTVLMMAAHAPGPALFFAVVSGLLIWLVQRRHLPATVPGTGQSDTSEPGSGQPHT